jgi:ElaB/YqjD/DUF883 family membrane-anchored ribosome-binding protein
MTTKQQIETLEAKFDKLLEIVGKMNNDKITETKKTVKKVTKTRKLASNTQTLDHITSLVKVVNKANGKEFSNEFVTQVPYASLSKFVDVFTQVTTNKDGEAVEKILLKQGFNSFKKSPDRIALTDDEAISLVGVMVKKYPQIREAITAL